MLDKALLIKVVLLVCVVAAAVALAATKSIPGSEAVDLVKYVATGFTVGVGMLGAAKITSDGAK
jgi:hypothetical protein